MLGAINAMEHADMVPMNGSDTLESRWAGLYRLGGVTALFIAVLLLGEILVYSALPRPVSVIERFALFRTNWLVGLLTLDLLGIISYLLFVPTILSFYMILRRTNEAVALVAAVLFLVGIAAFFATNTAFPMLSLSKQYAAASSDAERAIFVAAGQSMLTMFNENAFHMSYLIVSASWLLMSIVMFRSQKFGRINSYAGILAGAAGIVAVVLELSSTKVLYVAISTYFAAIVFLLVWIALAGRRLCKIGFQDFSR
jgi:hypothetical protein